MRRVNPSELHNSPHSGVITGEAAANNIEYAVYIHLPANENSRFWERTSTTHDAELALEQAEMLYGSQKYPKVEVTRKFFCQKRQRRVSETLRIFEDARPKASLWQRFFEKLAFWNN